MIGLTVLLGVFSILVVATILNGRTEIPEECHEFANDCISCHSHNHRIGK